MAVAGSESYAVGSIDDVDLKNRIAHVRDKTGASLQAMFRDHPGGVFTVPAPGEHWVLRRVGYTWHLDQQLDTTAIQDFDAAHMQPGDVRLRAESGVIWLDTVRVTRALAAPISGTWDRGDMVFNVAPISGGTMGWVCVTAGTPGTWKTWGSIA